MIVRRRSVGGARGPEAQLTLTGMDRREIEQRYGTDVILT